MCALRRHLHAVGALKHLLCEDETDVLLFPPLRASWAQVGQQSHVPLSGFNAKRVLFGTLDLHTGRRVLLPREHQRAADFCAFVKYVRACYPHDPIVMLLDSDPSHTAQASRLLAQQLDIELLFLPYRCPELNPMDSLWRHGKQLICANRQYRNILDEVQTLIDYLLKLPPQQALHKAGVLSPRFWLRLVLAKFFCGLT